MRDKRPVDELSIEELERILAVRKREARQGRLQQLQREGRMIDARPAPVTTITPHENGAAPSAANGNGSVQIAPAAPPALAPAPITVPTSAAALPQFDDGSGDSVLVIDGARRPTYPATPDPKRGRAARSLMDRLLLLVEIAAVIGVVVIGASLLQGVQTLERETAAAQQLADEQRRATIPTLEPTPTLRLENYVLPGGHTVDTATGSAQFNFAEVPSHLAPLVQTQWVQPVISRPPPSSETALNLSIPALNISQSIVQGVDWEALKQGIGQLPNGVNPSDPLGNLVLAAHNDIYGDLFRHLDQLEPGDEFTIQTATNLYTYRVSEPYRIVRPNEVYVLENRSGATATLISCYPYQQNTHRIVVFAERV
jgi:sortase A